VAPRLLSPVTSAPQEEQVYVQMSPSISTVVSLWSLHSISVLEGSADERALTASTSSSVPQYSHVIFWDCDENVSSAPQQGHLNAVVLI